jgi:hypothetical protein
MDDRDRLAFYSFVVVRIACRVCSRKTGRDYCPSSSFHLQPNARRTDNVTQSERPT